METKDFDFDLPKSLIAQHPVDKRDHSRLLHLVRKDNTIEDKMFYNLYDLLQPGDTLVLNNTKVLPARLYGHRVDKDESIEVLLVKDLGDKLWECLAKPGKKLKINTEIIFSEKLSGIVESINDEGNRFIRLKYSGILEEILDEIGTMPTPPYIHEKLEEKDRYQTIYAKYNGSSAAPTAGLHFTKELLEKLKNKGIQIEYITLHVGLGTFRPVLVDQIENHHMHSETYYISEEVANHINKNKAKGGRIIAVGTTSIRTLESAVDDKGILKSGRGETDIFIYPGYQFKIVDALITNFHLPKSTLIMLVSAFYSREKILKAYEHAIAENYRFFSFGDAMFIE